MVKKQTEPSLSEPDQTFLWLRRNRGICSQVARDLEISPTFVRAVLYGYAKSTDRRVEKALVKSGAPFVAARIGGPANPILAQLVGE